MDIEDTGVLDRITAIGPDNPAYGRFRELFGMAAKLEWARVEHDENEVDITLKGIIIARFVPTDDGFRILFPSGPTYRFPMDSSGDTRDGLTRQVTIGKDSDTYEAAASIRVAHRWADSMVSDDDWFDS